MDLKNEVVHSSEEDPCDIESAELAETYGTPPTRLNSIKPLRKLASEFSRSIQSQIDSLFVFNHALGTIICVMQVRGVRSSRIARSLRQRERRYGYSVCAPLNA